MEHKKVIISVAPVAASPHSINPECLAQEVTACAAAGAAMVHLHVRDKEGYLTADTAEFQETISRIHKGSDIIIQGSTGGLSDLTIKQRCAPLDLPLVETCSLNVGSVNLGNQVYLNPIEDVKYCVNKIIATEKVAEIEIFELGMLETGDSLRREVTFPIAPIYNLVVGHKGASPATPRALTALWQNLPTDTTIWGFTQAHRQDFSLMGCALGLGARLIRIGLEDSPYLNGSSVSDNVLLVQALSEFIKQMGLTVATPKEARTMLGLW